MDLKEFQKQSNELIEKIDAKHAGKHDTDTTIVHILEEMSEIARQLYNKKIGRNKLDKENLSEEIADCMILLSRLANNFDIEIEKSVENKFQKLRKRFK